MSDIGWISLTDADTYFDTRLENSSWPSVEATKISALTTAYNRIRYCDKFSIPAVPSIAQKVKLADAQCEMSYYLIIHLADEDRRKGIQAQGVTSAGIVKESYDSAKLNELPIPPIVLDMLKDFSKYKEFYVADIDRDEDEAVDEDVTDV